MQPEDTEYLMKSITSEANQQKLQQDGTVDFGFAFGDKARFRVSAFRARGNIALVLRTISNNLLTLEQIGLPMACKDILFRPRGLVLVTGPTGSGKSTTLASMIDVINHERSDHIITIEDPIEFYHTQGRCRSLAPSSRTRSSKSAISSLAIVLYAPRVIGGLRRGGGVALPLNFL